MTSQRLIRLMPTLLLVTAWLTPISCAAPDLSIRQGRFLNLLVVLANAGHLDDPDEMGRLLRTRFEMAAGKEHGYGPSVCPETENGISEVSVISYVPAAPFWFTDEIPHLGMAESPFLYEISHYTRCDGSRYTEATLQFSMVENLFCISAEDVSEARIPGVKSWNTLPGVPWGEAFDGWAAEDVGVRAVMTWPLFPGARVNEHGPCLSTAAVVQRAASSAPMRRRERERERQAQGPGGGLLGPGRGTAVGGIVGGR